jgi:hypothetical protein
MGESKKPATYQNFETLTKGLLGVTKASLDKKLATYNAKKADRNKKPKKSKP